MKRIVLLFLMLLGLISVQAEEVLILSGGRKGHKPFETEVVMKGLLEEQGFTVTCARDLAVLEEVESLKKFDLIIPNWTMGEISDTQLKNLSAAVKAGAGLAGIHGGMGDAFRGMVQYEQMVGGHFKSHPYKGEYVVDAVMPDHPVMEGVAASFAYRSEKYFMIKDSAVTVLADVDYSSLEPGFRMPVAWVKTWGKGRVFYSSLGHNVPLEYEQFPEAKKLFINGCLWATRKL